MPFALAALITIQTSTRRLTFLFTWTQCYYSSDSDPIIYWYVDVYVDKTPPHFFLNFPATAHPRRRRTLIQDRLWK